MRVLFLPMSSGWVGRWVTAAAGIFDHLPWLCNYGHSKGATLGQTRCKKLEGIFIGGVVVPHHAVTFDLSSMTLDIKSF